MVDAVETFQISVETAELYESTFVPALFGEWAPHLVEAAEVAPAQSVLDVACGTGVVARAAADRLAGRGSVVGLDLNEGMLEVARRIRPDIDWRHGDALDLPFPSSSFDVVLCQSALMFFPDRRKALNEMARVATGNGTVAVQVWGGLDSQPAYGPFVQVAARHAGPEAISLLSAYWALGDLDLVAKLFEEAGLEVTATRTRLGTARFGSIDELVRTEVESTPLIDRIDDETYRRITEDSREVLGQFRTDAGTAEIPILGHLMVGQKH